METAFKRSCVRVSLSPSLHFISLVLDACLHCFWLFWKQFLLQVYIIYNGSANLISKIYQFVWFTNLFGLFDLFDLDRYSISTALITKLVFKPLLVIKALLEFQA